jgi:hypothetical protein
MLSYLYTTASVRTDKCYCGPRPESKQMVMLPRFVLVAIMSCTGLPVETLATEFPVRVKFALEVDCDRPFSLRNYSVHSEFDGFLSSEQKAFADLTVFSGTNPRIHFAALANGAPSPAPGGYSSLKVLTGISNRDFSMGYGRLE